MLVSSNNSKTDNMRIAVLDLGTNTFHLLIVDIVNGQFIPNYRERIYTKLGENGTDRIGDVPFRRGLKALEDFSNIIKNHNVEKVKAIGTSALRTASNGNEFIQQAYLKFNIEIEVIDGLAEAEYIYHGVQQAIPPQEDPYMIMDIGGGSVEFIIADTTTLVYKESFKVGLSPLHSIADISDVAQIDDVIELHRWLASKLPKLYSAIKQYKPVTLVGSAGAFEVLVSMTGHNFDDAHFFEIDIEKISTLYVALLGSSKEEKHKMIGLPKERIDYISAAMVLIWHIIDSFQPRKILVSKYALKEGIISSFLD